MKVKVNRVEGGREEQFRDDDEDGNNRGRGALSLRRVKVQMREEPAPGYLEGWKGVSLPCESREYELASKCRR